MHDSQIIIIIIQFAAGLGKYEFTNTLWEFLPRNCDLCLMVKIIKVTYYLSHVSLSFTLKYQIENLYIYFVPNTA